MTKFSLYDKSVFNKKNIHMKCIIDVELKYKICLISDVHI